MTTLPRRGRRKKAKESRKYRYQAGTGSHSGTYYLPPPGKDMCVTEAYTLLRVGADTFREDLKTLGFYSPEPEHRWLSWSQLRTLLGLHLFKRAITCRSNGQQSNLRIAFAALIRANQGLDPDTALTELSINLSLEFKELKNDYQQRIEPIKHILRKRCFRGGKSPGRKQEKQQSQQTGFPFS